MEITAKRKFWTDFFIASAVCFVDVIIFRLFLLFIEVVPIGILCAFAVAILAAEAVVFTMKTKRTIMFPLASLVFQFLNCIAFVIYLWCLIDGMATSETESGFMQFLELIAGIALTIVFAVLVVFVAVWCIGVFVVTLVSSLITKAVMDKKEKTTGTEVPQIETTEETSEELPSETIGEVI